MDLFAAEGIKVYGVSYDAQEHLKTFSDDHSIAYDLLSDEDSAVIKTFGILNTTIEPDSSQINTMTGRGYYGMPFPGVYVVGTDGRVTEKFFHRHYATRTSAGTLRDSALGRILARHEVPVAELGDEHVKVSAFLADEALKFEYTSTLYVRFEVAEGFHIYADPLPDGFIASTATVPETKGVRLGEAVYPPTHEREFPKLEVTLNVYEGTTDVKVPIALDAEILDWPIPEKP
ncbi:MAG: redoxin domain-containing protein, partial [Acidobacteriota bacterium]